MGVQQIVRRVLAILAVCAAIAGAFFGWVVYALAESADTNPEGKVSTVNTVQFLLGWVGIVPVVAMAYFVFTGSSRKAAAALAMGLGIWVTWIVCNDAAVHGWGRDMVLLQPFT